jgi:hypothetical protein
MDVTFQGSHRPNFKYLLNIILFGTRKLGQCMMQKMIYTFRHIAKVWHVASFLSSQS